MPKRFQMNRAALAVAMNSPSPKEGRIEALTALASVLVFSTLVVAIYIATFAAAMGG